MGWVRSFCTAAVAVAFVGCATEAPPPDTGGTLTIPLIENGPNGEVFHLANATFDITGIDNGFATTVNGGGLQSVVSVSAPPGLVNVFLRDGWTLERSSDGGATFQPVSALLATINPNVARVLVNVPVTLTIGFLVRDANGTLQIKLSVEDTPRELAGGVLIQSASGIFDGYASGGARTFDLGWFYDLFSITKEVLPDGTKQLVYVANRMAGEFYNDELGVFTGTVAPTLAGASLTYTVAARPDGTIELFGQLVGGDLDSSSDLEFGASAIDDITRPGIDPDGFPVDEFFYDSEVPFTLFTLTADDFGEVGGVLRLRHLIVGQPGANQ